MYYYYCNAIVNNCLYYYLLLIFIRIQSIRALPTLPNYSIWTDDSNNNNNISADQSRLPRVLNFFPVPVEEECLSTDGRRKGVCMNAYECRIQSGSSRGQCALGFGVCCVFTATCNQEAFNNITYFTNPDFPDLSTNLSTTCSLTVKKIDPEISQLRFDFIHFNLGQPNRQTGVCDEDVFLISTTVSGTGGSTTANELKLCGLNSGQHAYFDVESSDEPIRITMTLDRKAVRRMWEVRVIQVPFTQRAPTGCLQYHTADTGLIQTMNFADNGRHLAEQDYTICVRQELGMCSIAYEPCHENAFRIGANNQDTDNNIDDDVDVGSGFGAERQISDDNNCADRIVLPCDSDDLIVAAATSSGDLMMTTVACDQVHCGRSLCPAGETPCRIESSATPFTVGVHFGPSAREQLPDDNLGMCLVYKQLPCNV